MSDIISFQFFLGVSFQQILLRTKVWNVVMLKLKPFYENTHTVSVCVLQGCLFVVIGALIKPITLINVAETLAGGDFYCCTCQMFLLSGGITQISLRLHDGCCC